MARRSAMLTARGEATELADWVITKYLYPEWMKHLMVPLQIEGEGPSPVQKIVSSAYVLFHPWLGLQKMERPIHRLQGVNRRGLQRRCWSVLRGRNKRPSNSARARTHRASGRRRRHRGSTSICSRESTMYRSRSQINKAITSPRPAKEEFRGRGGGCGGRPFRCNETAESDA